MLYPLRFKTIFKDKIWGGEKIRTILGQDFSPLPNCGEAWIISGVAGSETEIVNGFLAGNTINEILEIYMDELVGERVYAEHPDEFPLLVKIIDSADWLSVQVHPNDELASRRGIGSGKTEMWYVLGADPGATLIAGFNGPADQAAYLAKLRENRLADMLRHEKVSKGDVFFIPSGCVHALGPGIMLAEIQQTSDTTYRIYDWDRTDASGNPRELHTDLALEAIDFENAGPFRVLPGPAEGDHRSLVAGDYFTTNLIDLKAGQTIDYAGLDSFVILLATEGRFELSDGNDTLMVSAGEAILLPATTEEVFLTPSDRAKLLEIHAGE